MADSVTFDTTQLTQLAEDLAGAGQRLARKVPRIIKRGAQNIKADAARRFTSQTRGVYLPHYPRSITYDIEQSPRRVTAEIGPEQSLSGGRIQGAFGPGIEFGSSRHAPIPHLYPAFDAEVPKTQAHLQAAAIGAVLKR